jgi:hypothetical protein
MSKRDVTFVALGRLLVVERYRETHQSSSTRSLRSPGVDRTGGHANEQHATGGDRAPARPRHG